jgi:hypothetical protein
MKSNFALKHAPLAVLFLIASFLAGCATAPPVDWNSRVGHYTYAQAVNELGQPNREIRLSYGATEFKWFAQTPGGAGMNNGFGAAQNFNPGFDNRYLQLTFDTNGVLTAWSKNY